MNRLFNAKESQHSLDLFTEWKNEQDAEIANRGADPDPAVEEKFNQFMLRQNLNSYVCYKELDLYTACLQDKNLIRREGDTGSVEVNTNNKVNERLCRKTHNAYVSCMRSRPNQEMILQNALLEPHCISQRNEMLKCMEKHREKETKTQEPQCMEWYLRCLRCGLNHMWNTYWRAITKFGDAEEYQIYQLSKDDRKRQEYLRMLTTTLSEQKEMQKEKEKVFSGYYISPEDAMLKEK
ncbi:unnamed protein product [Phytomonas sp. Hart1]|nr:unnamed protein product [Phytomonas sp. Hart1]|eukprot:CCW68345.1 unnamed protein product [Phytomonas sp. isolate Hart1]